MLQLNSKIQHKITKKWSSLIKGTETFLKQFS